MAEWIKQLRRSPEVVGSSLIRQLLHPFNSLFSRTTCVRQYQKGITSLDLNEARDDGVLGKLWH